jgi:hypothetical protein
MISLLLAAAAVASPAVCTEDHSGIAYGQAAGEGWYINNEAISWRGLKYEKLGLPRPFGPNDLSPIGEYHGAKIYADRTLKKGEFIFVLESGNYNMEPRANGEIDCVYQSYELTK